jgi:rare lipoprotein A
MRTAALAAGLATALLSMHTATAFASSQCGTATWYEAGGLTASGEPSAAGALTGAHSTLPFGTEVRVDNLGNGRSAVVRINERGRFANGRVAGLSRAAAEALGFIRSGVARVRLTVVDGPELPAAGSCPEGTATVIEPPDPVPELLKYPVESAGPTPASRDPMSARFGLAFQPESWFEFEMNKALEALLSRDGAAPDRGQ